MTPGRAAAPGRGAEGGAKTSGRAGRDHPTAPARQGEVILARRLVDLADVVAATRALLDELIGDGTATA